MSRYAEANHSVYMTFFFRSGWQVQFTEGDLKTPLPRMFTFADPEKIRGAGTTRASIGDFGGSADVGAWDRDGQGRVLLAADS
jgi:hypothetical protein